jgi:thiol-disulfide isomerase/thioredoxin
MKVIQLVVICILLAGCVAEEEVVKSNQTVNETIVREESIPEPLNISNNTRPEPVPLPQNDTTEVMTTDTVFPEEPVFNFNYTDRNGTPIVYFFHSPGCSACQDAYPIINDLEIEYPKVIFINYSLATQNGSKAYVQFADLHNLSMQERMVPQVMVNGTIITDRFNIQEKLGSLLENLTNSAS